MHVTKIREGVYSIQTLKLHRSLSLSKWQLFYSYTLAKADIYCRRWLWLPKREGTHEVGRTTGGSICLLQLFTHVERHAELLDLLIGNRVQLAKRSGKNQRAGTEIGHFKTVERVD